MKLSVVIVVLISFVLYINAEQQTSTDNKSAESLRTKRSPILLGKLALGGLAGAGLIGAGLAAKAGLGLAAGAVAAKSLYPGYGGVYISKSYGWAPNYYGRGYDGGYGGGYGGGFGYGYGYGGGYGGW